MVTRRSLTIIINIRTTKHDANDQRLMRVPEPRPQRCRPRSAAPAVFNLFSSPTRVPRHTVPRNRAIDGMPRTTAPQDPRNESTFWKKGIASLLTRITERRKDGEPSLTRGVLSAEAPERAAVLGFLYELFACRRGSWGQGRPGLVAPGWLLIYSFRNILTQ